MPFDSFALTKFVFANFVLCAFLVLIGCELLLYLLSPCPHHVCTLPCCPFVLFRLLSLKFLSPSIVLQRYLQRRRNSARPSHMGLKAYVQGLSWESLALIRCGCFRMCTCLITVCTLACSALLWLRRGILRVCWM